MEKKKKLESQRTIDGFSVHVYWLYGHFVRQQSTWRIKPGVEETKYQMSRGVANWKAWKQRDVTLWPYATDQIRYCDRTISQVLSWRTVRTAISFDVLLACWIKRSAPWLARPLGTEAGLIAPSPGWHCGPGHVLFIASLHAYVWPFPEFTCILT